MTNEDKFKTLAAIQNLGYADHVAHSGIAVLCRIVGDLVNEIEIIEKRLEIKEKQLELVNKRTQTMCEYVGLRGLL